MPFDVVSFESGGERLEGWRFRAAGERQGLVLYLHGIADNRQSGIGVARRLVAQGYDVYAFDERAHGRSTGEACTYGYLERHDVSRALDALGAPRAILLGHSLGASVALQAAAVDPRVRGVVAASSFSDLPTIVRERARWFHLPEPWVEAALARAGSPSCPGWDTTRSSAQAVPLALHDHHPAVPARSVDTLQVAWTLLETPPPCQLPHPHLTSIVSSSPP
jgi:pimeloyl-ACP methyl ester carboxylesterase